MTAGYVYILTNESMPGLVKIGRSKHGGRVRAKALHKGITGVPTPFKMEFELWSDDCIELEACIHEELGEYRVSPDREFFKMDVFESIESVMRIFGRGMDLSVQRRVAVVEWDDLMYSAWENSEYIEKTFSGIPVEWLVARAVALHITPEILKELLVKEAKRMEDFESNKTGRFGTKKADSNVIKMAAAE